MGGVRPGAGPAGTNLRQGEAALTVALRLRQVEDLVHVGLAQGTAEGGEEQAGHQEGAAQGGREVVALQLCHVAQPCPGLSPGQDRAQNPARKGGQTRYGRAGTQGMLGERWPSGSIRWPLFPEWSI